MKRLLASLAGAIGLGALLARRRRQREAAALRPSPAEELRAKLDEADAHVDGPEQEPLEAADAEAPAGAVGARRQDVHERARQAIDELH